MSHTNKPTRTVNVPPVTGLSHQRTAARNSSAILVGSQYKLGKRIGKGNFGEVRHGKNMKNNQDVAIKTVF
jgi:casein kinase 1 gamma